MRDGAHVAALVEMVAPDEREHPAILDRDREDAAGVAFGSRRCEARQVRHAHVCSRRRESLERGRPSRAEHDGDVVRPEPLRRSVGGLLRAQYRPSSLRWSHETTCSTSMRTPIRLPACASTNGRAASGSAPVCRCEVLRPDRDDVLGVGDDRAGADELDAAQLRVHIAVLHETGDARVALEVDDLLRLAERPERGGIAEEAVPHRHEMRTPIAADRRDVHRVGLVEERVGLLRGHLDEVAA